MTEKYRWGSSRQEPTVIKTAIKVRVRLQGWNLLTKTWKTRCSIPKLGRPPLAVDPDVEDVILDVARKKGFVKQHNRRSDGGKGKVKIN